MTVPVEFETEHLTAYIRHIERNGPMTAVALAAATIEYADISHARRVYRRLDRAMASGALIRTNKGDDWRKHRFDVNPDKSNRLLCAYSHRELLLHALEDAIVDALNEHGMMTATELSATIRPLPSDCAGFLERKPQAARVRRTCEDLVSRLVLEKGRRGYYIRRGNK